MVSFAFFATVIIYTLASTDSLEDCRSMDQKSTGSRMIGQVMQ